MKPFLAMMASVGLAISLPAGAGGAVDHCVGCHTDPARLVVAVREVRTATKGLPTGSALFAGEG